MFRARHVIHTLGPLWVGQSRPILLFALVTLSLVVGPAVATAQQLLTLSWVDNSGGQASFIIQRATGTTGTYTQIAETPIGAVSHIDATVALGTTYCYRVAAVNSAGMSGFSNLACGSPSGGFTLTTAKAGTGVGTVASNPAGITCGTTCSYTYRAGKVVTLTATPSSGSTFSGWSGGGCSGTAPCTLVGNRSITTTATFATGGAAPTLSSAAPMQVAVGATVPVTSSSSGTATLSGGFTVVNAAPATLTLAYNGKLRDRVGQDTAALGPDGALDGTLTATLSASGGRTVTGLRLGSNAPGTWNTSSGTGFWVLAVAPTLDGAVLNAPGTMAVNFPVADGGSFVVFASDYQGGEFLPGRTLTLTATFADGSTATAVAKVQEL